jgi:hypothetical protein
MMFRSALFVNRGESMMEPGGGGAGDGTGAEEFVGVTPP